MTVRDLFNQIQIDDNYAICQYNEKTEDLIFLTEQEAMDIEIKYIYPLIIPKDEENNIATIYIEVEPIEKE